MKFAIFTLGCKVNTYESNVMSDILKRSGYIEVNNSDIADIYIINTCSVTNTADSKSLKVIRHAISKNEKAIIIVTGCFAQVKSEVLKEMPVSIIIGNKYKSKIDELLNEYLKNKKQIIKIESLDNTSFEDMIVTDFSKTRAFVKIQDGCNNFCSYCIIPYTRGSVRSKEKDVVLNEVKTLVEKGHKEIVLTGIHTGNYGAEFENYDFANLLEDILKIKGLERLRISSIEMNELNDRVLKLIKENDILVSHLHIPLQSGSDKTLKDMNRKYDKKQFIEKIDSIRKIRKDISITTDVIVGFPTETKEDFNESLETIKKINFSKIHVFPFSKRDNTKAALMQDIVTQEEKKKRTHILLELSKNLENNYMNKFMDCVVEVIPEMYKDGYLIGHTGNYLQIKFKGEKEKLNKIVKVKIVKNEYPYLLAIDLGR